MIMLPFSIWKRKYNSTQKLNKQTNVEGKGDGSGIVEFDIKENQIIKDSAKFTYELNVKVNDSLTVNTIMSSSSEKIMEIN